MRYWVRISKKSVGPFTPQQLRKIDEVNEETLVCPVGATAPADWKRLKEVPALAKALEGEAAPAPEPEPVAAAAPAPAVPSASVFSKIGWLLVALPLGALVFGGTILGLRRHQQEAVRAEAERAAKQKADEAQMAEEARRSNEQRFSSDLQDVAAAAETRMEEEARLAAAQRAAAAAAAAQQPPAEQTPPPLPGVNCTPTEKQLAQQSVGEQAARVAKANQKTQAVWDKTRQGDAEKSAMEDCQDQERGLHELAVKCGLAPSGVPWASGCADAK